MDVEGAEHVLLPHMIITGALCLIDVVFTECHNWGSITLGGTTTDNDFAAFFEEFVQQHDQKACETRFRTLDDETYGSSEFSLPELLRSGLL